MLKAWNLDCTQLYVDILVIVSVTIVSHCATYAAMRLMAPYRTIAR